MRLQEQNTSQHSSDGTHVHRIAGLPGRAPARSHVTLHRCVACSEAEHTAFPCGSNVRWPNRKPHGRQNLGLSVPSAQKTIPRQALALRQGVECAVGIARPGSSLADGLPKIKHDVGWAGRAQLDVLL